MCWHSNIRVDPRMPQTVHGSESPQREQERHLCESGELHHAGVPVELGGLFSQQPMANVHCIELAQRNADAVATTCHRIYQRLLPGAVNACRRCLAGRMEHSCLADPCNDAVPWPRHITTQRVQPTGRKRQTASSHGCKLAKIRDIPCCCTQVQVRVFRVKSPPHCLSWRGSRAPEIPQPKVNGTVYSIPNLLCDLVRHERFIRMLFNPQMWPCTSNTC